MVEVEAVLEAGVDEAGVDEAGVEAEVSFRSTGGAVTLGSR